MVRRKRNPHKGNCYWNNKAFDTWPEYKTLACKDNGCNVESKPLGPGETSD